MNSKKPIKPTVKRQRSSLASHSSYGNATFKKTKRSNILQVTESAASSSALVNSKTVTIQTAEDSSIAFPPVSERTDKKHKNVWYRLVGNGQYLGNASFVTLPVINDDGEPITVAHVLKKVKSVRFNVIPPELGNSKLNAYGSAEIVTNIASVLNSDPIDVTMSVNDLLNSGIGKRTTPLIIKVPVSAPDGSNACSSVATISGRISIFELENGILSSKVLLPYPQEQISKCFIRQSYVDVFDLILESIQKGARKFGITGTPGVGKSLFFLYILFRALKGDSLLKPKRIVYQLGAEFLLFDLEDMKKWSAIDIIHASVLLHKADSLYVIDGRESQSLLSSCVTIFICSPHSDFYKNFVKQTKATQWFLPVWTLEELKYCREKCYPDLSVEFLSERFRIFGGVARFIFWDEAICIPHNLSVELDEALTDELTLNMVLRPPQLSKIFSTSHSPLHVVVDEEYQYSAVDVTSDYVAHELCVRHYETLITNLPTLLGKSPNTISRHLFKIYGHRVFSKGDITLKCRNLTEGKEDIEGETEEENNDSLSLHKFDVPTTSFGKNSIPTILPASYYETTDYDFFPAIDSFSPQGMFQFTVSSDHPIRGVQTLKQLCKLYEKEGKKPKLYFVVPSHRFASFKKQVFKGKNGNRLAKPIENLEQYVVELPVGI